MNTEELKKLVEAAIAVERERCLEMVSDEQLYPSNKDCRVVNPAVHRAMRRIEDGTTLDDLRDYERAMDDALTPNVGVEPHSAAARALGVSVLVTGRVEAWFMAEDAAEDWASINCPSGYSIANGFVGTERR